MNNFEEVFGELIECREYGEDKPALFKAVRETFNDERKAT